MKKVKVLSESWKDELDKYRIGQMENEDEPYSYAWLVNVSDAGDHVAKNNWMYLASLFGYTSKDLEPYFDKQASKEGISAEDLDAKGKSLAMADFLNDDGYQAKVVQGSGTETGYPKKNESATILAQSGNYTLSKSDSGELGISKGKGELLPDLVLNTESGDVDIKIPESIYSKSMWPNTARTLADKLNSAADVSEKFENLTHKDLHPDMYEDLHEDEDSNVIDSTGGYTLSRRPDGEKVNQWHSKYVIDNPGRIADLLVHGDDQTGYTVETSVYMPQQMRTDELKRYLDDLNTILSIAKKFEDDIKKAESK